MVSRFINELDFVKNGSCVMSVLEDVIPFYHISAGVWTAVWDGGFLKLPKTRNDGWE